MFKVGDWVVLARMSNSEYYTETGLYSFGVITNLDSKATIKFAHINRPECGISSGHTFRTYLEDLELASKLHKIIYGIDTEQETSYTDNKENDT